MTSGTPLADRAWTRNYRQVEGDLKAHPSLFLTTSRKNRIKCLHGSLSPNATTRLKAIRNVSHRRQEPRLKEQLLESIVVFTSAINCAQQPALSLYCTRNSALIRNYYIPYLQSLYLPTQVSPIQPPSHSPCSYPTNTHRLS